MTITGRVLLALAAGTVAAVVLFGPGPAPERPALRGALDTNASHGASR